MQAVNVALIDLYWQVGKTISDKLAKAEWGEGVVEQLALHIAGTYPGLRGFARPNLYRMRQFFEVYKDQPIVSTLLRQLSWSHNLAIMGQCKRADERQFYLEMSARENWPFRELERQIKGALFERSVLSRQKSRQCCDNCIRQRNRFSRTPIFLNSLIFPPTMTSAACTMACSLASGTF